MYESKYSNVLTVILVIVIAAIIGLLGFLGYDYYQKYFITKETSEFVENYYTSDNKEEEQNVVQNEVESGDVTSPLDQMTNTPTSSSSGSSTTKTYKGFNVMGAMSIPKIDFNYPVLERVTKKSIEVSVAILTGVGLNEVGNTVISGHNYRNGLFFSNNKKLVIGDKIYITDNSGQKLTYTIYNKFETTEEDVSFYDRDTNGKPEVTLSTCTDDSSKRLIIFARAD